MFQYPLMANGTISGYRPKEDILDLLHPVAKRASQTRLEWLTGKEGGKKRAKVPETAESYSPIDEAKKLLYELAGPSPNTTSPKQQKGEKTAPAQATEGGRANENPAQNHIATGSKIKAQFSGKEKYEPAISIEKTFSHAKPIPKARAQANPIILDNESSALPALHDAKKFSIPIIAFTPPNQYAASLTFSPPRSASMEFKSSEIELLSHSSLKSQSPNLAIRYLDSLREFVLNLAEGSRPSREKLASLLGDAADSIKSGKGISDELYGQLTSQLQLLADEVKTSLWKAEIYVATARFAPMAEKAARQENPSPSNSAGQTIAPMQARARKGGANAGGTPVSQDADSLDELASSPLMSARFAGGKASRCIVSKSSTSISNHHSISRGSHRHCPIDGFIGAGGISTHVLHFRSSLKVFYNGLNWIGGWYLVEKQCRGGRCL